MGFRRSLAATMVGGLCFVTGCPVAELSGLLDTVLAESSSDGYWYDTYEDVTYEDPYYYEEDILDRKSG